MLPRDTDWVGTPPIKCQGIKTKLVPFIFRSVIWRPEGDDRWIEPFFGSGVVALNLAPARDLLADSNEHIVRLYRAIKDDELTPSRAREYLQHHGRLLELGGAEYYYEVRERFNHGGSSLDFLFLNRSCFNGVIRFNRKGAFNVPFGHKPGRFTQAYTTKIVNQVAWAARQMRGRRWQILHQPWEQTLGMARKGDFVYLDPPYIGRHTDYYDSWDERDAARLAERTLALPCGFAASMWLENRHRRNDHIAEHWNGVELRVCTHFYHVGSTQDLRNEIDEALLIRQDRPHRTRANSARSARQRRLPLRPGWRCSAMQRSTSCSGPRARFA
ncbi:MAG: Dam family site-specific DNA-(adenine-N6)-methyltransferase [Armatimonadetes bacterium]|nr:Dam family site-specific DNA-(adenine-N6)-methyltransferase [Armatimonadota bacterium]